MLAGAASTKINPHVDPQGPPIWLAGYQACRRATAIHDDLTARAVVVEASETRVALVSLDLIGLFADEVSKLRSSPQLKMLKIDHLIVACTHTHSGPDTLGLWSKANEANSALEDYRRQVRAAILEILQRAVQSMLPVRATCANARTPGLIRDALPPVVIDDRLRLLRLQRITDSTTVATIVNWSNHAEVLDAGNTQISADFPAPMRRALEEAFGGVALFFAGAIGGLMTPRGVVVRDSFSGTVAPESSYTKMELLGQQVAQIGIDAFKTASSVEVDEITTAVQTFEVPLENSRVGEHLRRRSVRHRVRLARDGKILLPTEVSLVRIGPSLLLALPGEIYPELVFGFAEDEVARTEWCWDYMPLAQMLGDPDLFVIGLANDELGYIVPPFGPPESPSFSLPVESINSPSLRFAQLVFAAVERALTQERASRPTMPV